MALIVQKFGGSSVGTVEKIRRIADKVIACKKQGHEMAVVVSAMQGETDRLISLAREVNPAPSPREYDVLVSTGEQVSCALLALALQAKGQAAESLLAHQVHIHTDELHSKAEIRQVDAERIRRCIAEGKIAVVAGFQGLNRRDDITTLGRGGGDLTAIAVAIVLDADLCEIYTDVKGVYTADPNICPSARLLPRISYEEMLELAGQGAKVLQARSVGLAMKFKLPVHVLSSFEEGGGTVVQEETPQMEKTVISGVTCDKSEARITLRHCLDRPQSRTLLFERLAEHDIQVDMILQNISEEGRFDLTFTVPRSESQAALELAKSLNPELQAAEILFDDRIAKVSAVGVGIRRHSGVAACFFQALAAAQIPIKMVSTSEIKISCVVEEKDANRAVAAIHEAFGLGVKDGPLG